MNSSVNLNTLVASAFFLLLPHGPRPSLFSCPFRCRSRRTFRLRSKTHVLYISTPGPSILLTAAAAAAVAPAAVATAAVPRPLRMLAPNIRQLSSSRGIPVPGLSPLELYPPPIPIFSFSPTRQTPDCWDIVLHVSVMFGFILFKKPKIVTSSSSSSSWAHEARVSDAIRSACQSNLTLKPFVHIPGTRFCCVFPGSELEIRHNLKTKYLHLTYVLFNRKSFW